MKKWLRKNLKKIIEPIIRSSLIQERALYISLPIELDGKKVNSMYMEAMNEFEGMVHTLNHQQIGVAKDGYTKMYDINVRVTESMMDK